MCKAASWWSELNERGCAFINALAELPDPQDPARQIAIDQKQWLFDLLKALAAEAGATHSTVLATQLLLLHEGALATQPLHRRTIRASIELAHTLTEMSLSGSPT